MFCTFLLASSDARFLKQQECAKRGDLFEVAARFARRQLPESTVMNKIVAPMTSAIAFLHARGIIHRDLKPENVVVMTGARSCAPALILSSPN